MEEQHRRIVDGVLGKDVECPTDPHTGHVAWIDWHVLVYLDLKDDCEHDGHNKAHHIHSTLFPVAAASLAHLVPCFEVSTSNMYDSVQMVNECI